MTIQEEKLKKNLNRQLKILCYTIEWNNVIHVTWNEQKKTSEIDLTLDA